jgi:cytochrome P450
MLVRYPDIVEVALDPRFSSAVLPPPDKVEPEQRRMIEILSEFLFVIEPPNHTRIRGLMNKAFAPCIGDGLRERIQQLADSLLDRVQGSGRMDIIRDLAIPLPLTVIAEVIGLPLEDRAQFKQWIDDFNQLFGDRPLTPEEGQKILQSVLAMNDYCRAIIEQRRREPKHDLITRLALAEEQGAQLSQQELLTLSTLILVAGQKTTTDLIGNGLLALLQNPDQMQKLQDESTLIESAVEEFLRYESPKQWITRRATEDIELHGAKICKDQLVLLMLGAANRDPARFPDPDRLNITRTDNRHLAFGYGRHMCGGLQLARMNGQIAISTVLRRMPGLKLETDSLEWSDNPFFRGLKSLPVKFS